MRIFRRILKMMLFWTVAKVYCTCASPAIEKKVIFRPNQIFDTACTVLCPTSTSSTTSRPTCPDGKVYVRALQTCKPRAHKP